MHASADIRNIERSVMVALMAAAIPVPLVPDGDEKFDTASATSFVRVSFRPMEELPQGRVTDSGTTRQAIRARVLLVGEVYAQGNGMGAGSRVDDVDGLASAFAGAVRYLNVPLIDYVTDPTGATPVSGVAVRFTSPPHLQRVPPADGWYRRIVTTEGHWFLRHSTT